MQIKKLLCSLLIAIILSLLSNFYVGAETDSIDKYNPNLVNLAWENVSSESDNWYVQPTVNEKYAGDFSFLICHSEADNGTGMFKNIFVTSEANRTYFPSSLPASRKSSAGEEYGKPIFTGTDQSPASSSHFET